MDSDGISLGYLFNKISYISVFHTSRLSQWEIVMGVWVPLGGVCVTHTL